MKSLIFFGSDRFSAVVLSELIKQKYHPSLVVTDPPKPKGKKGEIAPNEVEKLAKEQSVNTLYYQTNNEELIKYITNNNPVGLSASFPHIFTPDFIKLFDNQLYNLHPSLLPQYRNVAPGPYAIAMGDAETGITLQHIDEKIDHGSIVTQLAGPVLPTDTTSTLLTRLFTIGTKIFIDYLSGITQEPAHHSEAQKSVGWIFTRKLTRESGFIEWEVIQKLINNKPITVDETSNPLIKLRLSHHPQRMQNILSDLIRALDTYEKVWTNAETKKGIIPVSLVLSDIRYPIYDINVLIPGKPRPIPYADFAKYYL